MKSVKCFTFAFILILIACPLFSMDLSIEDALKLAMQENLQIKSSKVDLDMSESAYKYSYNTFIPDISFSATFSKPNENAGGLPGKTNVAFTYGFSGSWTFNPAMITSVKVAHEKYANGEISYEQACAQLNQNIRKLYYGIVLQQEALSIEETTLKSKEERYKQAQTDYENGFVPEISLLQSQVAYQNEKPIYEDSVLELKNSKRQLAFLLGLDLDEDLNLISPIEYSLEEIEAVDALSRICDRYDIRLLESNEKLTKMQKTAIIESTFLPSVVLKASWQPYNANIKEKNWYDTGSISGTVAWNLTNLLPSSGQVKNLKDINKGLEKLELGRKMAEENARIEILNLLDVLNQTKSRLESSESTVKLAQASFDMRQESYRLGMSDYLDLQDAETQLLQAKLGKLSNQYSYVSALIDLEYATGQQIL